MRSNGLNFCAKRRENYEKDKKSISNTFGNDSFL